jgi:hypothetical protein
MIWTRLKGVGPPLGRTDPVEDLPREIPRRLSLPLWSLKSAIEYPPLRCSGTENDTFCKDICITRFIGLSNTIKLTWCQSWDWTVHVSHAGQSGWIWQLIGFTPAQQPDLRAAHHHQPPKHATRVLAGQRNAADNRPPLASVSEVWRITFSFGAKNKRGRTKNATRLLLNPEGHQIRAGK